MIPKTIPRKTLKNRDGLTEKMSLTLDRASQEVSSSPADNGGTQGSSLGVTHPGNPSVYTSVRKTAEINLELTQGGRRNKRKAREGYWRTRGYCLPQPHS